MDDTGRDSGDGITSDTSLTVSGTAEPGSDVAVSDGVMSLGTVRANATTGVWSYVDTRMLADGSMHSYTATATDAAGNTGLMSVPFNVMIDATAPAAPVITGVMNDTGRDSGDGITSDTSLTVSGTSEPGSDVDIYDDGVFQDTVRADATTGAWEFVDPRTLADGSTHPYTARATDTAGNVSPESAEFVAVIDLTAPNALSFTRQDPATSPTDADELVFRVTFDEAVSGVDLDMAGNSDDFVVVGSSATVTDIDPVSGAVYNVTVSGGDLANLDGMVCLDFSMTATIDDLAGNAFVAMEPPIDDCYVIRNYDYGDAPEPYPTVLADGGARHLGVGPILGDARDNEADGVPSLNAQGDDAAGAPDDEDGVSNRPAPVGAYLLDGTADDETGSADGSIVGTPTFIAAPGGGQALLTDSGNYVAVPSGSAFVPGNDSFSVSLQFRVEGANHSLSFAPLLVMQGGDFSEGASFTVGTNSVFGDRLSLLLDDGGGRTSVVFDSPTSLLNEWHEAAYVVDRDASTATLYLDGEEVASAALTVGSIDPTQDLLIGQYDFGSARGTHPRFVGGQNLAIDNVRIFGAAIDPTGPSGEEPGPFQVGQVDASLTVSVSGPTAAANAPSFNGSFSASLLANVARPGDLAVVPAGSGFTPGLYVLNFFDGTSVGGDGVTHVATDGTTSQFASLLAEADPISLAFSPASSDFGDFLYVSSNNRDGGRGGDQGGTIQRLDTVGSVTDFTAVGLPNGPGEPNQISFGSIGGDTRLLLANSRDFPGDILDVQSDGSLVDFVDDGLNLTAGLIIREAAFPTDPGFGDFVYAAESATDTIIRVDHDGNIIDTFAALPAGENIQGLQFAPGGAFGTDLYVRSDTAIYRVQQDGTVELFADDFSLTSGTALNVFFTFSEDGNTMYISDRNAGVVYEVQPQAKLDVWFDWNQDGNWGGPNEHIVNSLPVSGGNNTITFDVPGWATPGDTYGRFRLSTADNVGIAGTALDGEIEDYLVTILPPALAGEVFLGPNVVSSNNDDILGLDSADIDGDGDIDLVGASRLDNKIAWYENDGAGQFSEHIVGSLDDVIGVVAADLDGDLDIDIVVSAVDGNQTSVYLNDGSQNFSKTVLASGNGRAQQMAVADVDGDGHLDIITTTRDTGVEWLRNDGMLGFTRHTVTGGTGVVHDVQAADLDRDGDLDFVFGRRTTAASGPPSGLFWAENDGSQSFTTHQIDAFPGDSLPFQM
ncbi:MAG: FG-GAP-like repeat-containing protein, partial [Planctomycetota bacterium]